MGWDTAPWKIGLGWCERLNSRIKPMLNICDDSVISEQ